MKRKIFTTLTILISIIALGQTTFNKTQTITLNGTEGDTPYPIVSADIDSDGYNDIVVGTDFGGSIFWFKNDGFGNFTIQPIVTNSLPRIIDIELLDINGDTTIDILATSFSDDKVVYYPNNLANPGTFGSEVIIAAAIDGATDVDAYLLNGDSFLDVVVSAFNADKIVWFAGNGNGTFGSENNMINTIVKPGSFDLKDVDTDGDLDLVVANAVNIDNEPGMNSSVIEVFFNSALSFTKDANSVTNDKAYLFNVSFEDINSSNNSGITRDIVATDIFGDLVHYNRNASGVYDETIISSTIANPASVALYDLDISGDGLKDIILSSGTQGAGNDLVWFKNNGNGNFSAEQVIDNTQSQAYKFTIVDFDNDGDLDIASTAYNDDQISIFNNQTIVLSTQEFERERYQLYPNPVSDYLRFNTTFITDSEYTIFTILGQKLKEDSISTNGAIDVTEMNSGIYYLRLNDSQKVYKFIKN